MACRYVCVFLFFFTVHCFVFVFCNGSVKSSGVGVAKQQPIRFEITQSLLLLPAA